MMVVEEERSMEEGLLKLKNQNDASDCRITACVILSTFVAVCGSFSFGVAVGYTSGAEIGIMQDIGLSIAEFSAFGSFSTLGATVGALLSGKMAIMLGRRGTMWVSNILCITGWLSIAFAKDVLWLDFGRISSGIGIGLTSYVAKVGTEKELENSLLRLRGRDADISHEASEIQLMTRMIESDSMSSFSDLFQRKYRHTLVVGIGLMLIQQFSGSAAVISYASTIFRKAGFSVAIGSTMLGLFMIPKAMIGLILVDKWGRRPLLLIDFCVWDEHNLHASRARFRITENAITSGTNSSIHVYMRYAVYCNLCNRRGRPPLGNYVRDISNKYKSNSREFSYVSLMVK
ncbi:hypothetical protein Bca101_014773 [Brassica carinata]